MMLRIYHNPRCSKSRQTLELLEGKGLKPEVVEYLKTPPSLEELDHLLQLLGLEPEAIVRSKDEAFAKLGLAGKKLDRKGWLKVLAENPALLERPIVVHGERAALGRPPENVLKIL